jgi:hypothetical protein
MGGLHMVKQNKRKQELGRLLWGAISIMLMLSLAAACSGTMPSELPAGAAIGMTQTTLPTSDRGYPTDFPTTVNHETFDAEVEQNENTLKTEVALTPTPPEPTFGPPEPTPTLVMGIMPGCPNRGGYDYIGVMCWRGLVDGQILTVMVGSESPRLQGGDISQGVVLVYHSANPMHQPDYYPDEVYKTPFQLGPIRIDSVDGMRFTLETYDALSTPVPGATPTVIIFDLATRQFVSP